MELVYDMLLPAFTGIMVVSKLVAMALRCEQVSVDRTFDGAESRASIEENYNFDNRLSVKSFAREIMEADNHRLTVFGSHLRNSNAAYASRDQFAVLIHSNCLASTSGGEKDRARVSGETANLEKQCIFCRIIRGESPAYKIYEDDKCLCILDTSPLSRGHSLVIPRAHFQALDVTPPSVIAAMTCKIPFISKAIMKATGCDYFNLLVNNGIVAGQVIFHTHIHIIPRQEQDCLWASESLRRLSLKLDQEASDLAQSIRDHILFPTHQEKDTQRSS